MNDSVRFQRLAAISALLAVPLAFGSGLLLAAALNFDPRFMFDPASIISIGPAGARLLRWGMILDVFGYYLLLAPLALHLWDRFKPTRPNLITLVTLCGIAYILIGSMGAIVLAAVLPPLVDEYARAPLANREVLQVVFSSCLNAVYLGLWNPLEAFLFGIWLSGIGAFIQRERWVLGVLSRTVGFFALLDAFGRIVSVEAIFFVGVAGILIFPILLPWFAIGLLRRPASDVVARAETMPE